MLEAVAQLASRLDLELDICSSKESVLGLPSMGTTNKVRRMLLPAGIPVDGSLNRCTTRSMVLVAMAATTAFALAQAFTMEPSFAVGFPRWAPVSAARGCCGYGQRS